MTADDKDTIAQMSYAEIVRYMDGMNIQQSPMRVWTALTQRLYEISIYDHHVPYDARKDAWERLDTVKFVVERGFKQLPEAIANYRAANRAMEEGAFQVGIASLGWLVEESGVSSTEELIAFITRPEYADLLETFYSTLGPEISARLRQEVARRRDVHGRGG